MIYLMLDNTREPSLSRHTDRFTTHILALDEHFCSTTDVFADVARNAQATFWPDLLAFRFHDLWIEDSNFVILIFGHKHTDRLRNLWSSQANATGSMHRLKHIINKLL